MMLVHPVISGIIDFKENESTVVVLENPSVYRSIIAELISQAQGFEGQFVLSEDFTPVEISKHAELITDVFGIDFSSKKLLTKINQGLIKSTADKEISYALLNCINEFAGDILMDSDVELKYEQPADIAPVIKLLNFHIDADCMTFTERITEYMRLCRQYMGKKLFIFINLRSCLTENETEEFYKTVNYEKYSVLLIENHQPEIKYPCEKIIIIDKDMCQIG